MDAQDRGPTPRDGSGPRSPDHTDRPEVFEVFVLVDAAFAGRQSAPAKADGSEGVDGAVEDRLHLRRDLVRTGSFVQVEVAGATTAAGRVAPHAERPAVVGVPADVHARGVAVGEVLRVDAQAAEVVAAVVVHRLVRFGGDAEGGERGDDSVDVGRVHAAPPDQPAAGLAAVVWS